MVVAVVDDDVEVGGDEGGGGTIDRDSGLRL